jgi:anion-transporting  ArsA/GET3 family ATPase
MPTPSLLEKRLILVCGKGGVGRSTVAARIAAACARRGRKTLLFEASAADRFGAYFGRPAVGTDLVPLGPNLWAINTNPAAALHEYGLMILKFETVYEMVFENKLTKAFLRAIPGLDDYSVIGKAWYHTTEEKRGQPVWDTVVFDMPASGHSQSMLRIPWVIIDTVPEGPLTRDARDLQALLRDQARTALVLVSLAEEMPANEARELQDKLSTGLGIEPQLVVANQVYPDRFPAGSPQGQVLDALLQSQSQGQGAAPPPTIDALAAHADLARSRRALNERYLEQLRRTVRAPLAELPLLFVPRLGPDHVQQLSQTLEKAIA